jgi:hypothetical protein
MAATKTATPRLDDELFARLVTYGTPPRGGRPFVHLT